MLCRIVPLSLNHGNNNGALDLLDGPNYFRLNNYESYWTKNLLHARQFSSHQGPFKLSYNFNYRLVVPNSQNPMIMQKHVEHFNYSTDSHMNCLHYPWGRILCSCLLGLQRDLCKGNKTPCARVRYCIVILKLHAAMSWWTQTPIQVWRQFMWKDF